jgi:MipA family protein
MHAQILATHGPLSLRLRTGLAMTLLCCAMGAIAQSSDGPEAAATAAAASAAEAGPAGDKSSETKAKPSRFEGAIGLILAYRPEFSGASRSIFKLSPGVFLRYGRFTLTNASGFATKRVDDVVPGLGLDLVRNDRARAGLSLRVDQGRGENSASAFAGLGKVRPTLRLRAAVSAQVQGPWRVGASWSADLLGRQGGGLGDLSAGWETKLSPTTKFNLGASVGLADSRYLQTYYGISAEQAARTAYPEYRPTSGLRDMGVYANWRHDIGRDWILLAGANATRLLGPAAQSPLTRARNGWGTNLGAARQF